MSKIRIMTENDVDFATKLTNFEKWANSKADFERLIKLNPDGNFVAYEGDNRVGMITSAIFGRLAFIGNLIVPVKYRNRGVGRGLMKHLLKYLSEHKKIETIELDGDFPAIELYRKLGFIDKYFSLRFCRRPAETENGGVTAGIVEPEKIAEIDNNLITCPKISRNKFLSEFAAMHNGQVYVNETDGIGSFSIIRKCFGGYYVIGPTMASNRKNAEQLIKSIVANYSSEVIYAGVPEINRDAVAIMLNNNFYYEQPSLRMYHGKRIDYEKNIYTILSGDVG